MPFNASQGYPQQPFGTGAGPHNPMPFTQLRAFGARVGMRYGSFDRHIGTVPLIRQPTAVTLMSDGLTGVVLVSNGRTYATLASDGATAVDLTNGAN